MKKIWITLINLYQRFISPYKGFRCAHAAYYGGSSCSSAVKSIIGNSGLIKGLPVIRKRFAECRQAYLQILADKDEEGDEEGDGDEDEKEEKPSKWKRIRNKCAGDCITSPCDSWSNPCSPFKDSDVGCDINPCDSAPCDVPCDCGPCGFYRPNVQVKYFNLR